MKMFKKLMAVTLAGVMALAMLTGCGASVNKKEIIATINDMQSMVQPYHKVEYTDAGVEQANKVITVVQNAYEKTAEDQKADFDPMEALKDENGKYSEVAKALGVTDKTNDAYSFNVVEIRKYNSQYNQDHATTVLASELYYDAEDLNTVNTTGNKGTVSINTVTVGDTEYAVAVFKVIA